MLSRLKQEFSRLRRRISGLPGQVIENSLIAVQATNLLPRKEKTDFKRLSKDDSHPGGYPSLMPYMERYMSLHLEREVSRLKKQILALCSMVEESCLKAIQSLEDNDIRLAQSVIGNDDQIDDLEILVEEECMKILALHQPVAVDLRYIVSMLKINNDLERIGDLSVDIAGHVINLQSKPTFVNPVDLKSMAEKVLRMVKDALDALIRLNHRAAYQVCSMDDEVDADCIEIQRALESAIQKDPHHVSALMDVYSMASYLEQMADHAKKVSEDVIYLVEAHIVRHRKWQPQQDKN
ncbi:MAG: phosphate signaling complex protein PhoU [SAR324 cluster bacterium]|nr:phosphate signaling complex protein PhoU [SAR324 cluster bacterium]